MNFLAKTSTLSNLASPCIVLGVFSDHEPKLSQSAQEIDKLANKQLSTLVNRGDISGKIGSTLLIHTPINIKAHRLLLVGLGKEKVIDERTIKSITQSAIKTLKNTNIAIADFALLDGITKQNQIKRMTCIMVQAASEAIYVYDETKTQEHKKTRLKKIRVIVAKEQLNAAKKGISQGSAIAKGVTFAKTISNLPGNICTPIYLAKQAKDLEQQYAIETLILSESEMKKHKMNALLSVSRGSHEPAKLIVMKYKGGKSNQRPVVLVGKGLTFDAGGISIKPAAAMDEMKYDMCGGASVFGTIIAVAEMSMKLNLIGIVPASENLPDGAANKPGDIVTSMAGKTIEILNTDAEGRLILCDALTYAARFNPDTVVDIATLTGACVVALGHHASGLFSNDENLAKALLQAGETSGDRVWQMPIWDDYDKQLHSNFADMANIGGYSAGAITAACFLARFTKKYKWAHLDIAGTAWQSGPNKGATGRPVPLLTEFLLNRC